MHFVRLAPLLLLAAWFSSDSKRLVCSYGLVTGALGRDRVNLLDEKDAESKGIHCSFDRDFAWAVVDHQLIVRKIPEAKTVLTIAVRGK